MQNQTIEATETIELEFFSDPGHGWLQAPIELLDRVGVTGQISRYSYIHASQGMAYLEEDCDLPRLLEACKKRGTMVKIRESRTNQAPCGDSFIRRLDSFPSAPKQKGRPA